MLVLLFLLPIIALATFQQQTVYQKITQDATYGRFNDLIKTNGPIKLKFRYGDFTLFVPTNEAFDRYTEEFQSNLAFYHMTHEVKPLSMLRTGRVETVMDGFPPLWLTESESGGLYVNNAKVVENRSDYIGKSRGETGNPQVLHVIDEVLDPMVVTPKGSPTVLQLLRHPKAWRISPHTATSFLHKIQQHKLENLFKSNQTSTYFIPVDSGIDADRFSRINSYTIQGHIVPDHVLFTRPTPRINYETMCGGDDYIKMVVQFVDDDLVRLETVLGDSSNLKGVYYSHVVKANIPVENGVVHLIDHPLGVAERHLKPFPYLSVLSKISMDPQLDFVYQMGEKSGFNRIFTTNPNASFTYFVSTDSTWRRLLNTTLEPIEDDYKILGKHLVISPTVWSMERLLSMSRANNYSDITLGTTNGPLRITVVKMEGDYYVKWRNRYIRVVRPDYECSDGMVHILDGPMASFRVREDEDEVTGSKFLNVFKRMLSDAPHNNSLVGAGNLN